MQQAKDLLLNGRYNHKVIAYFGVIIFFSKRKKKGYEDTRRIQAQHATHQPLCLDSLKVLLYLN